MDYYFTFGTASHFPYGINDYVKVTAPSEKEAVQVFREKYPDYHEDTVNCAFIYAEEEFKDIKEKYYKNIDPVDELEYEELER